jgi:hypothetical protein
MAVSIGVVTQLHLCPELFGSSSPCSCSHALAVAHMPQVAHFMASAPRHLSCSLPLQLRDRHTPVQQVIAIHPSPHAPCQQQVAVVSVRGQGVDTLVCSSSITQERLHAKSAKTACGNARASAHSWCHSQQGKHCRNVWWAALQEYEGAFGLLQEAHRDLPGR